MSLSSYGALASVAGAAVGPRKVRLMGRPLAYGREPNAAAELHCDDGITEGMVPVRGFAPLRNPLIAVGLDFSGAGRLAA